MRKLTILFLPLLLAACSNQGAPPTSVAISPTPAASPSLSPKAPALAYLKGFVGKVTHDVEFWTSQPLNDRLKKLLGDQYPTFIDTMETVGPISEENGVLYVTGHNKKTNNAAIFVVDEASDVINVKLVMDKTNKVNDFAEPGKPVRLPADAQLILSSVQQR